MSTLGRWLIAGAALAGIGVLLVWSFIVSRKELAHERESERSLKTPAKVSSAAGGSIVIALEREAQERIDLATEPVTFLRVLPSVDAYGEVLDPAPLIALEAELSAAEAALNASRAELERVRKLYRQGENASRKALEAAEAQFKADDARSRLPGKQIRATWGSAGSSVEPSQREELMQRLARRQTLLVRVTVPASEHAAGQPSNAMVVFLGFEDRPVTTSFVVEAPTADQKIQGQSFFLRIDNPEAVFRPGSAVMAHLQLPGKAIDGVEIQRSAAVRSGGKTWVYVQVSDEKFTPREIVPDHPTKEGWFVVSGFDPHDRIVVRGAQVLLSEQFKSQIQILEGEGGEEEENR
jgi:hypothetical protein